MRKTAITHLVPVLLVLGIIWNSALQLIFVASSFFALVLSFLLLIINYPKIFKTSDVIIQAVEAALLSRVQHLEQRLMNIEPHVSMGM